MYDPDAAISINHGGTKLAGSKDEQLEFLRNQNAELLYRLAKCECGQTGPEHVHLAQPFDAMLSVVGSAAA